ncbi:MAG: phosphatase PAP2 family protein [Fluviicola sp.]|nr:phosphatase PAP2 family protein [Fluviicola sp.]
MQKVAQTISWVFNPLLMPIYALLLVMYIPSDHIYYNPYCMFRMPESNKLVILYRFFLLCTLFPGLAFFIMAKFGMVSSIEMNTQKERAKPILVMFIFSMLLYISTVIGTQHASFIPKYIFALPLSGAFVTLVFYFLNKWKKVSIHAAAVGMLVGFLFAYLLDHEEFEIGVLAIGFVLSGLVMSARLFLKKHTLEELIIGWIIGSFITFIVNYFYFF